MTTQEERDATFAGARQAVQVHSDPDVGLDEIEVTPDDRPAPPAPGPLETLTEHLYSVPDDRPAPCPKCGGRGSIKTGPVDGVYEYVLCDCAKGRPAPPQAELAAALDAQGEYRNMIAGLNAEVEAAGRRELLDRFAVILAPAVYEKLYKLSRGGPVTNDDFARELWGAAEAAVKGRPPQ